MNIPLTPGDIQAMREAEIAAAEALTKPRRPLTPAEIDTIAADMGFVAIDQLCPKCHAMRVNHDLYGDWVCMDCGACGCGPKFYTSGDERERMAADISGGILSAGVVTVALVIVSTCIVAAVIRWWL